MIPSAARYTTDEGTSALWESLASKTATNSAPNTTTTARAVAHELSISNKCGVHLSGCVRSLAFGLNKNWRQLAETVGASFRLDVATMKDGWRFPPEPHYHSRYR
jgi:hypothetical protein